MISNLQFKKSWVLIGLAGILLSSYANSVFADEEKTIEQYIEEARPYLHLSCQGAWPCKLISCRGGVAQSERASMVIAGDFNLFVPRCQLSVTNQLWLITILGV